MEPDVNNEILINAVRKRASLYDTSRKSYHDRVLKKRLWYEVCQKVYTPAVWNSLSGHDKFKYEKEVVKRWNSLRHSFRRELIAQKNVSSGITTKKRRKYIYFDSLKFLLPFTGLNYIACDNEQNTEQQGISSSESETNIKIEVHDKIDEIPIETNEIQEMHNVIVPQSGGKDDEDELFLRSLIPYMKEFSGDHKLMLRMEIIKSILNFKQSLGMVGLECIRITNTNND